MKNIMKGREKYITRMGREVEDVLDEFLSLTIDFEQKNVPTLENFINWIISRCINADFIF